MTGTEGVSATDVIPGDLPTILLHDAVLQEFLAAAVPEYRLITPEAQLPCFALLLGTVADSTLNVEHLAFGRNAKTTDPAARREFTETIVPRFGPEYGNELRGWWFDSADLLRISYQAEAAGLDILGSIHMHPDWHRICPELAGGRALSEHPTPMDRHAFGSAGWPVNLICYLETRGGAVYHALGAWALPEGPDGPLVQVPLRVRTAVPAGGGAR
ncbi:hypothetical protein ACFW1A_35455 [Kitasatospora sp. NPDC058965]|uniref:hypothetical protein n=1 Tax=Kitasatospora sp. NPDC058965 TaxID=3346682 RepID=UPI0036B6C61F